MGRTLVADAHVTARHEHMTWHFTEADRTGATGRISLLTRELPTRQLPLHEVLLHEMLMLHELLMLNKLLMLHELLVLHGQLLSEVLMLHELLSQRLLLLHELPMHETLMNELLDERLDEIRIQSCKERFETYLSLLASGSVVESHVAIRKFDADQ